MAVVADTAKETEQVGEHDLMFMSVLLNWTVLCGAWQADVISLTSSSLCTMVLSLVSPVTTVVVYLIQPVAVQWRFTTMEG